MEKLAYDFELDIATAHSRLSKKWRNKLWKWSDILAKCADTKRTGETVREYIRMSREEQSGIKDVGGFVGGYLSNGTRKTANVLYRTLVTLDIDYGTADVWDDFTLNYDCAAMVYSTHKHTPEKPRLRLVLPASRQMSPAEYEPVCRYWTSRIGIELFDHTTYQLARLFYWPSTSSDGEYVFEYQDGPAFDVDAVLATYRDPRDASEWPVSSREGEAVAHEIKKAGDPLEKPGLIGAFCRAYSIEEAIEAFLPEAYEKTAAEGRYTYKAGSVAGGCVTYEGKFAFSHHATDPASMRLCNAFDLVRIHKFGIEDEGSRADDVTRLPSYLRMQEFAAADKEVRLLLARERRESAASDFEGMGADDGWMAELDCDKKGSPKCTIGNFVTILENDPAFKGRLLLNLMDCELHVDGGLPWDKSAEMWGDRDDSNLRGWMESRHGMSGKDKISDALNIVITRHSRHPVREYFNSLKWDGTPRLDTLIIDYLGAEDSELNRAITRIHFVAAVARIMQPGVKYDYCLILAGPQGVGKSTLIAIMGGEYYKDGLITMEGKEGRSQIRGKSLVEIGELDAMKRSEISSVKQYITATYDEYRPAYGRRNIRLPRQCVFFGTTNERHFLKDDSGNRRFPIIPIQPELRRRGGEWFDELRAERDQLWAEAVARWKEGTRLYLPSDMQQEMAQRQNGYSDSVDDPLKGMLLGFVDTLLPPDWDSWDLARRRAWLRNPDPLDGIGTVRRDRICAAEFICERMGRDMADKEYKYIARKVCAWLEEAGWEKLSTSRHAERLYGRQKAFKRPEVKSAEDEDAI